MLETIEKPITEMERGDITELLDRWRQGDASAAEDLMPKIYDVLHRLAVSYFQRERSDHTLQATAIINEAYMILLQSNPVVSWNNRAHFIGFMAQIMRRVLVDYARNRNYAKRGGHCRKVTLLEAAQIASPKPPDLIDLDEALSHLGSLDPKKASLVELRFFGGLSVEEAAKVLEVSRATAVREWRTARAWLYRELNTTPSEIPYAHQN